MPNCTNCETEFCNNEIQCLYSCGPCCTVATKILPDQVLVAGTLMGQRDSDLLWGAFDPNASNGLQIPRGVLRYDITTNECSQIMNYVVAFFAGCQPMYTNVYYEGSFRIEDTHGNLAAALSHPGFGRLIEGNPGGTGSWKLL